MAKIAIAASLASIITVADLDSLANGSGKLCGTGLDNTTTQADRAALYFTATFGSAPTANGLISVYLVPSMDGTNYADTVDGASPFVSYDYYAGAFQCRASASAQKIAIRGAGPGNWVTLLPKKYKAYVINNCGVAFPTGVTLQVETYS